MTFEDRLREHLTEKADGVEIDAPSIPMTRSRKRAPLVVAGIAMALVLAVGALVPLFSGGGGVDEADEGAAAEEAVPAVTSAAASAADVTAGDGLALQWEQGSLPPDEYIRGILAFDGGYLAWGEEMQIDVETGPSVRLWTSADGLAWDPIPLDALAFGPNEFIENVVAAGDNLVAVGTAYELPPEGEDPPLYGPVGIDRTVVWMSADGQIWQRSEFDPGLTESTKPGEYWGATPSFAAASGDGIVVLSSYTLDFDPFVLIEPKLEELGLEMMGMGFDGNTVEILDENSEVVESFTLEELGVDVPDGYFERGGPLESRAFAFTSSDGVAWDRHEVTGLPESFYLIGVAATGQGMVALGIDEGKRPSGTQVWTSSDGISWQESGQISGFVNSLSSHDDRVLALGASGSGASGAWLSDDGGRTWNDVAGGEAFASVGDLMFSLDQGAIGPFGLVAIGSAYPEGPPPLPTVIEKDGVVYTEDHMEGLVTITDAATGDVIFSESLDFEVGPPEFYVFDEEALAFSIVDPDTGETLFSATFDEMEAAAEASYQELGFGDEFDQPVMAVLYSADGTTWSRRSMEDALGASGYPMGIVSGGDRVIVAFMAESEFRPTSEEEAATFVPPPTEVWVGTLG